MVGQGEKLGCLETKYHLIFCSRLMIRVLLEEQLSLKYIEIWMRWKRGGSKRRAPPWLHLGTR